MAEQTEKAFQKQHLFQNTKAKGEFFVAVVLVVVQVVVVWCGGSCVGGGGSMPGRMKDSTRRPPAAGMDLSRTHNTDRGHADESTDNATLSIFLRETTRVGMKNQPPSSATEWSRTALECTTLSTNENRSNDRRYTPSSVLMFFEGVQGGCRSSPVDLDHTQISRNARRVGISILVG